MPQLDPATTALVLIDLQQGIASNPSLAPRSGDEVIATAKTLAERFRAAGAPVVLVHVDFAPGEMPSQAVDKPLQFNPADMPDGFAKLVEGLRHDGDIVVLKHHWGAFTGTDLDLQLRRRGVRTIVLAGIATNFGVESTARSGWELSYDLVIVEDACASRSADLHRFAIENILPQLSRIVAADAISLGR